MIKAATQELTVRRGRRALSRWMRRSLAREFAVASSLVLLAGMLVIGTWVTARIEGGVMRSAAGQTALYMESLFGPLLQELGERDTLSAETIGNLRAALDDTPLGQRIAAFKIWKEGGLIVFSTRPSVIGTRFPVTERLNRAWQGEVTAEFDEISDEENRLERAEGLPFLEIYSPIRDNRTGRIIAVAEAYEVATELERELFVTRFDSWLLVAAVTLSMLGLLAGIVMRGSRTIERQQRALQARVFELSNLLAQNEELRLRVQRAAQRTAEINERYLRRIGADLHDGPAQLLALAALRLEAVEAPQATRKPAQGRRDLEIVRESLSEAMAEIRNICSGLVLPEVERQTPEALLRRVALTHERRTGTGVSLDIGEMPRQLPEYLKISLYRIAQEALSNAFRHAGGAGQVIEARLEGSVLTVSICDSGPGFDPRERTGAHPRLGLSGLAERVQALGGELTIDSAPGRGTRITVSFVVGTGDER